MWPPAHCFAVLLLWAKSNGRPWRGFWSPPTEMRRASALSLIGCGQSICMRPFGRPHPVICITLSADGEVHRKAGWASANSTPAEALCGRSCLGRQQLWACPGHNPITIPGLSRRPQIDRDCLRTQQLRQLGDVGGERARCPRRCVIDVVRAGTLKPRSAQCFDQKLRAWFPWSLAPGKWRLGLTATSRNYRC
jgi:hypothetical protein